MNSTVRGERHRPLLFHILLYIVSLPSRLIHDYGKGAFYAIYPGRGGIQGKADGSVHLAVKLFIRFALAKAAVTYGMELMMALFNIVQGVISSIMSSAGFGTAQQTVLPQEIIDAVEDCGFLESIPLWAVTLIGGLFITVLSFVMIMTVYGRFFKLYLYTAIAPVPLSAFAGEPSQNVGRSFLKSYAAVCLEGAIIVLACVIFSVFASSPPSINSSAAPVTMVWSYIAELVFNMLVLVGAVKMADRVVREMMGL